MGDGDLSLRGRIDFYDNDFESEVIVGVLIGICILFLMYGIGSVGSEVVMKIVD